MHQAVESAPNCLNPVRHPPWPGGMREAMKSGHRALRGRSRVVYCPGWRRSSGRPSKPTTYHEVISPSPPAPRASAGPRTVSGVNGDNAGLSRTTGEARRRNLIEDNFEIEDNHWARRRKQKNRFRARWARWAIEKRQIPNHWARWRFAITTDIAYARSTVHADT